MLGLHLPKYPIPKWGQKGKTIKYVRAYLEEIEEEGSDRLISSPTERRRRRRAREDRRETERERVKKLILGYSKKAAFQVRIFSVFFFFFPLLPVSDYKKKREGYADSRVPCVRRARTRTTRHGHGRQIAVSVSYGGNSGACKRIPTRSFLFFFTFGRNNDTFSSSSSSSSYY